MGEGGRNNGRMVVRMGWGSQQSCSMAAGMAAGQQQQQVRRQTHVKMPDRVDWPQYR